MKEDEETTPLVKKKEKKQISSEEQVRETEGEKNRNKKGPLSKGIDKSIGTFAGVLLIAIGGPVGIFLGGLLLLAIHRKALSKVAKAIYKTVNKSIKHRKIKKQKIAKKKEHSLSMDKTSLKKIPTRNHSVSKINILPKEASKSTTNTLKPAGVNYDSFKKPTENLSKKALKQRNTITKKTKALSNSKIPRPTFKTRP